MLSRSFCERAPTKADRRVPLRLLARGAGGHRAPARTICLALAAAILFVITAPSSAPAQEPPSSQPASAQSQPQASPEQQEALPRSDEPETTATDLRREAIQDHVTQIQAAGNLPETVKMELLSLYRQALDQLNVAENWETKIREFEVGRERAPELLRETKARLEQTSTRPTTQPVPDVSPDETLEQVSQKLASREAELKAAQDAAKRLDEEAESRAVRKAAIPELLADANRRLERITKDLSAAPAAGTLPQVTLARRTLLLAQKKAVAQEIREYEEELRYYEARSSLLAARREEAKLAVTAAQALVTAWQKLVSERRQTEIDRQKQAAEEELRRAPGPVRELVEENRRLAEDWDTVGGRIKELQERFKAVTELTARIGREFSELQKRKREDPDALAQIIGPEMRRKRMELMLLHTYERELRALRKESGRAERRVWEIDEEALLLNADLEARVADRLDEIESTAPRAPRTRTEERIRVLYTARRDTLRQMQPDYHAYAEDLRELRAAENKLLAKVDQFRGFIDEHILWLRSTVPLHEARLPDDWARQGTRWWSIRRSLLADAAAHSVGYALAALVLVVLVAARRKLRARLHDISQRVARPFSDSYVLTLRAGAQTVLLSLPWPALVWFLGWRVGVAVDVTDAAVYELAQAAASGLCMVALLLWTLSLLWHACRKSGLAETHFRWDPAAVRLARRNIGWLILVAVPVVFVVYTTERHSESAWRASVGRAAFMLGMVALAVFLYRLLRPASGILANRLKRHKAGWLYNLRYIWYPLAVGGPLALAVTSASGFHYTAVQLSEDLTRTAWLIVALLLLHALLVRWLFVAQRRLAIEQARKKRAAAEEAQSAGQPAPGEAFEFDEAKLNLVSIGDQARRLLRGMAAFGLIIGLWVIWADMLPALSFMGEVELWSYTVADVEAGVQAGTEESEAAPATITGQHVEYITLAHVALAVVVAVGTFILARNIPGLLEIALLQRLPLDIGGRYAITTLARYTIAVIGIIAAFTAIGIGWTKVQWLVAAMTVGLGFGLQEIFANFVSGVMLLFERPIRIGDTVTVGDITGTVTRIRIRATTITDWDRKELVIPNKEFIAGQVVNWSLSDLTLRITVPVGIAYGSNTDLAEEILYKAAAENEHVLADPWPRVIFMGFGDSSLNFELRVFIPSVEHLLSVRHQLHKAIDREFRQAGIEIAFPQRDVHMRSIRQALPIAREPEGRTNAERLPDDTRPVD